MGLRFAVMKQISWPGRVCILCFLIVVVWTLALGFVWSDTNVTEIWLRRIALFVLIVSGSASVVQQFYFRGFSRRTIVGLLVLGGLMQFFLFPFSDQVGSLAWWPEFEVQAQTAFPALAPFAWLVVVGSSHLAGRSLAEPNLTFIPAGALTILGAFIVQICWTGATKVYLQRGTLSDQRGATGMSFPGITYPIVLALVAAIVAAISYGLQRLDKAEYKPGMEPGIVLVGSLISIALLS